MLIEQLQETADFIRSKCNIKPKVGIILGSGLGTFADQLDIKAAIPYNQIPHFKQTSVEGHKGQLILAEIQGVPVACLQGRIHYYEGHTMSEVVFPTRTLAMLGIEKLILTNAAGSLHRHNPQGSFLIIKDHINLVGANPLMGPNLKKLGPRFPDMTETYDREMIAILKKVMTEHKVQFAEGVYCGVSGPTYETPAEVEHLRRIGGDAVGMSTVPEAIAANHLGLRIAAVSCFTNLAAGISETKLTHEEVTEAAKKIENQFAAFIKDFIAKLA